MPALERRWEGGTEGGGPSFQWKAFCWPVLSNPAYHLSQVGTVSTFYESLSLVNKALRFFKAAVFETNSLHRPVNIRQTPRVLPCWLGPHAHSSRRHTPGKGALSSVKG